MSKTIIDSLREYFLNCPILDIDSPIYVDYRSNEPISYSINTLPSDKIRHKQYIGGGGRGEYDFTIDVTSRYASDVINNLNNIGFSEHLQDWIKEQDRKRSLPKLPPGKQAIKLVCTTGGYLFSNTENTAVYSIQLKLFYVEG